jgi:hypothetical protein
MRYVFVTYAVDQEWTYTLALRSTHPVKATVVAKRAIRRLERDW